jgi:hypothetical protein
VNDEKKNCWRGLRRTILFLALWLGAFASCGVSASAQSQFEKLANLTPGQKYTLDCGAGGILPLRQSLTERRTIDSVKCGTPVTLLSKQDGWAYVRTNDQRIAMSLRGFCSAVILPPVHRLMRRE